MTTKSRYVPGERRNHFLSTRQGACPGPFSEAFSRSRSPADPLRCAKPLDKIHDVLRAHDEIDGGVARHIPPRDAHEHVGTVEATVCLLKGKGTVYRAENPAFCKNGLHRSQLEHVSRPRTVRYLAVETHEEAMLDQAPEFCPAYDVPRTIGKPIRQSVGWKPRQNNH